MANVLRVPSLGEQLAYQLRRDIISGHLEPGRHLVEDALAEEHDVSRGPVRDALRILKSEGLLEDRRRGFFVRSFTRQDVEDLYSLRASMESLAFSLAAERAKGKAWSRAERELQEMYSCAEKQDGHGFAEHDLNFHSEFYALSSHSRLQTLWDQYRPTFGALLDVTNADYENLETVADDHRELLRAAQEGRTDELLPHLAAHLASSKHRMIEALEPTWQKLAVVP